MGAVGGSISNILMYNLPDDYYSNYINVVKNLSISDLTNAAKKVVFPDKLVWVIVGDKAKIEGPVKELGYEIKYIDGNGNVIE
ncbi:MAG: hypothetical protein NTX22_09635 [Ignavibacteriales bacterium]|nr:hypothetical protein [Ignavibacteriales bacterium]